MSAIVVGYVDKPEVEPRYAARPRRPAAVASR